MKKNTKPRLSMTLAENKPNLLKLDIYTFKAMDAYAELVRIIGETCHSWCEGKFYWTLSLDDCESVQMEIIFSAENDQFILELYEIEPEIETSKKINYDIIYALMGYACSQQMELKHNDYLHIEGNKS